MSTQQEHIIWDIDRWELKNPNHEIKTAKMLVYLTKDDVKEGNVSHQYIQKYDEVGNNIESLSYDSNDDLEDRTILVFENGQKKETLSYLGDGSLEDRFIFKYDKAGNRIEEEYYNSEEEIRWKAILKYNDKLLLISRTTCNSFNTIINKKKYHYDGKERKTEEVSCDKEGIQISRIMFAYTGEGKITEKLFQGSNNETEYKQIYEYQNDYKKISTKTYSSRGNLIQSVCHKYDSNNNLIEASNIHENTNEKYIYSYNEDGNRMESKKYLIFPDGKGEEIIIPNLISRWRYEYYNRK